MYFLHWRRRDIGCDHGILTAHHIEASSTTGHSSPYQFTLFQPTPRKAKYRELAILDKFKTQRTRAAAYCYK